MRSLVMNDANEFRCTNIITIVKTLAIMETITEIKSITVPSPFRRLCLYLSIRLVGRSYFVNHIRLADYAVGPRSHERLETHL